MIQSLAIRISSGSEGLFGPRTETTGEAEPSVNGYLDQTLYNERKLGNIASDLNRLLTSVGI